jgi:hypothetical protein
MAAALPCLNGGIAQETSPNRPVGFRRGIRPATSSALALQIGVLGHADRCLGQLVSYARVPCCSISYKGATAADCLRSDRAGSCYLTGNLERLGGGGRLGQLVGIGRIIDNRARALALEALDFLAHFDGFAGHVEDGEGAALALFDGEL